MGAGGQRGKTAPFNPKRSPRSRRRSAFVEVEQGGAPCCQSERCQSGPTEKLHYFWLRSAKPLYIVQIEYPIDLGVAFLDRQQLKPAPGMRRPSSSLHPPFVHLVVGAIVPQDVGPRTRLRTALEGYYSSTPGVLARVRVIVSRSVIT